jgi:hypothetical protein
MVSDPITKFSFSSLLHHYTPFAFRDSYYRLRVERTVLTSCSFVELCASTSALFIHACMHARMPLMYTIDILLSQAVRSHLQPAHMGHRSSVLLCWEDCLCPLAFAQLDWLLDTIAAIVGLLDGRC